MKAVFALPLLILLNPPNDSSAPQAGLSADQGMSVEAPWTAEIRTSDPGSLQLNVSERRGSVLGTSIKLAELEGLSPDDLDSGKPATFRLRREAGIVTFSGRFRDGEGKGTLHYDGDAGYWSRIRAMGVEVDWSRQRHQLLALPLLDVRTDYIASLRREGALGDLQDYVGMKAVGVAPELVREVKPLIERPLKPHDLISFAALGVTADYARELKVAFASLKASDLSSMRALDVKPGDIARYKAIGLAVSPQDAAGLKALGVTPDYVAEMRAAGARIGTAGDAQSFRALGISPAAVKRTVARGKPNPSASDVMEVNARY